VRVDGIGAGRQSAQSGGRRDSLLGVRPRAHHPHVLLAEHGGVYAWPDLLDGADHAAARRVRKGYPRDVFALALQHFGEANAGDIDAEQDLTLARLWHGQVLELQDTGGTFFVKADNSHLFLLAFIQSWAVDILRSGAKRGPLYGTAVAHGVRGGPRLRPTAWPDSKPGL